MKKNKKINDVKMSEILPPVSDLSYTRYTFDAWMKCYPESNRDEWEERTFPYCTGNFIASVTDIANEHDPDMMKKVKNISIEPLGDAYFEYLQKTRKTNDTHTRCNYAGKEEDKKKIFEEEKWFRDYCVCCLPLMFDKAWLENSPYPFEPFDDITHFSLTDKTAKKIEKILENIYGKGNVFVSNYFLKPDVFEKEKESLIELTCAYFEDGKRIRRQRFSEQKNEGNDGCMYLALPIAIKGNFTKLDYTMDEIMSVRPNDFPGMVYIGREDEFDPDEEESFDVKLSDAFTCIGTIDKILPLIERDLPNDTEICDISTSLICHEGYSDFMEEIYEEDAAYEDMDDDIMEDILFLPRYSYTAIKKQFPHMSREEWSDVMAPYSTGDFVTGMIGALEEKDDLPDSVEKIMVQPFGDTYLRFLNEAKLKDSDEVRSDFWNRPDAFKEMEAAFNEEGWFRDYHLLCLPLLFVKKDGNPFSQVTDFSITKEAAVQIEGILENIFGIGNVFVSEYLLKPDDYCDNEKRLLDFACAYFEDKERVRFWKFKEQKNTKGVNAIDFALPVVIKGNFNKMEYTLEEIDTHHLNDLPEYVYLGAAGDEDQTIDLINNLPSPEFIAYGSFREVMSVLRKSLPDDVEAWETSPFLVPYWAYPEYMETYYKTLAKSGINNIDVYK